MNIWQKSLFLIGAWLTVFGLQAQEKQGYLFSYFDNQHEAAGLCLAYSYDGYNWLPLNGGNPLFRPTIGKDKLLRDPSICQGPDGTFHMVWTSSWTDQIIGYCSSKDLIHWTEQRAIPVMKDYPTTYNCWAPELFYDKTSNLFYILWSSTVYGSKEVSVGNFASEEKTNHRIYCTTTRDFKKFSKTKLYFNPDFVPIDAAVIQDPSNGELIMTVKNENITPEEKNIRITRASSMKKGFSKEVSAPIHDKEWCEGPSPLFIGNDLVVFYDKYRQHKYGASRSKDHGQTWEDITDLISMPVGMSHGTAFPVDATVIENLKVAYEDCYTVMLETNMGNITLQLYNDTPLHRDNLLKKIYSGTYNGRTFNRVISGFVIQCGEEQEEDIIPAEIHYPEHFHKRGVLAMGRCTADEKHELRSADEQFYIAWGKKNTDSQLVRADSLMNAWSYGRAKMTDELRAYYKKKPGLPTLDGSYTIFGEVIAGLDVVERIQNVKTDKTDRPLTDVVIKKVNVIPPMKKKNTKTFN